MTDTPKPEATKSETPKAAAAPMDDAPKADAGKEEAAAKNPPKTVWLTARSTPELGPKGRFLALTEAEAKAAPKGVLVVPTAEQLACR